MAIPELYARRAPEEDVDRINWAIDGHANVVAEIGGAQHQPGAALLELEPWPDHEVTRAPMCTPIPPMSSPRISHSPVCNPARTWMPSGCTASRWRG